MSSFKEKTDLHFTVTSEVPSDAYIDGHCHLTDKKFEHDLDQVLQRAQEKNIHFFIQGGIGPEEWKRQIQLKKQYPFSIGLCLGLHPYWLSEHTEEEAEMALDQLAPWLAHTLALGETGLDFRPQFIKDPLAQERQIRFFELQIELSIMSSKPLVLHGVRAHEEMISILSLWRFGKKRKAEKEQDLKEKSSLYGLVHSFNGSWKQAKDYIDMGFLISVGGPLCRSDNIRLQQTIKEVPLEWLVLETDSPDQAPYCEQRNEPETLIEVAKAVGKIKKMDERAILKNSTLNLKKLFTI